MTEFTASNDITVANHGGNWDQSTIHFTGAAHTDSNERDMCFEDRDLIALREFFQHERDDALGRWRWPENPDYVVYPYSDALDGIRVCQEADGHSIVGSREWFIEHADGIFAYEQPLMYRAARAYLDAHPEPKPWHDAQPGEVWVIVTRNVGEECAVQVTPQRTFQYNDAIEFPHDFPLTYEAIESARRIWPEVAS